MSHVSAKIQAVKHLHAVFMLFAEQRDVKSNCREPWFILTSLTLRGSMLLLEYKLNYAAMVYHRAFQ